jgi:hypothetical protein
MEEKAEVEGQEEQEEVDVEEVDEEVEVEEQEVEVDVEDEEEVNVEEVDEEVEVDVGEEAEVEAAMTRAIEEAESEMLTTTINSQGGSPRQLRRSPVSSSGERRHRPAAGPLLTKTKRSTTVQT